MKKTVFALQVIGLVVMLPMLAMLELNHVPLHQNIAPDPATTIDVLPATTAGTKAVDAVTISLQTFLFTITL
ncbi:MAG TPA: hypothetical protein VL307_19005 [Chitinophagaceae bacterium]|nr:hypothetical protein [Chitinophagaceae bacterium]